jgi:AraC family ethanolamine operon transcriptional activator
LTIHFAHNARVPVTASHLTSAFRHLAHRLDYPEEFSVAVSGASSTAAFLEPQAHPTRIEQFQSPEWAIDFHEAHVRARILACLPPGWASLGIMCGARPSPWYGFEAPQGTMVCTPPGEMIDGCTVPAFLCVSVGFSRRFWERCRQIAALERSSFGGCTAHSLPVDVFTRMLRQFRQVRRQLRQATLTPNHARQTAAEATRLVTEIGVTAWELSAEEARPSDSLRNRARLTRRADMWLREHLGQAVRVPDVCSALQVSRRELEYAFRHTLDLSPQEYLRTLRLNAIHRVLRGRESSDQSLLEIALEHGGTHPGRFAAQYRALFGHRPSETRRKQQTAHRKARRHSVAELARGIAHKHEGLCGDSARPPTRRRASL